jgi:hypothetical protein
MKRIFTAFLLVFLPVLTFAQAKTFFGGIGLGLQYGGIGFNMSAAPLKHLAADLGMGYNLAGLGVNGGLSIRFLPDNKVCPDIGMLYGYNAVIIVKNAKQYNKTFYGPTLTGGLKIFNTIHSNYLNLQLLLPFRSQAFEDALDNPNFTFESKPSPIGFTIGYNFAF